MTERELRKLSRGDLLEMLLNLSKENEQLNRKLTRMQEELEKRTIAISQSGSLAEAALKLNGVFEAAQYACDQYIQNIHIRYQQQETACRQMEEETRARCSQMVAAAKEEANAYKMQVEREVRELQKSYVRMAERMNREKKQD